MQVYIFSPMIFDGFANTLKASTVVSGTFNNLVYESDQFSVMIAELDQAAIDTLKADPDYAVIEKLEEVPAQGELAAVIAYVESRGVVLSDEGKAAAVGLTRGQTVMNLISMIRGETPNTTPTVNPSTTSNGTSNGT